MMSGLYSGSSIANVVTTGTFTIPLMKRIGFAGKGRRGRGGLVDQRPADPAGDGRGGLPDGRIRRHSYPTHQARLPAGGDLLHRAGLHRAPGGLKLGLKGLQKPPSHMTVAHEADPVSSPASSAWRACLRGLFGLGWIKVAFPNMTLLCDRRVLFLACLPGAHGASRARPDLKMDDPERAHAGAAARVTPTCVTGLYFLLPIVILVWCILMVDRPVAALSAFWATIFMIVIVLTQRPLKAMFAAPGLPATPGLASRISSTA
jgi:TRAP-type uncharacterized transport system fused permease subunit